MKSKLLFLLLVTTISFGQKIYTFDYLLEYEVQKTDTSAVQMRYIFTNAQNNSINIHVTHYKDKVFKFFLLDDATGVRSIIAVPTENLDELGTVQLNCQDIKMNVPNEARHSNRFLFTNVKDTMISGVPHKRYTLEYAHKRDKKRFQNATRHYIVENETEFHKPMVSFSYPFDSHVTANNIPNGIAREMYSVNHDKKQVQDIFKLKSITAVNMKMVIPKDCDKLSNIK
jgi:hypothetical protein